MKRFLTIIAVLAAVRLAVMAIAPVFDPSEARYAAISANMARTGDYVVPHFTYKGVYQSFDGKPPLVFQAGGLCCAAFGVSEFAVRLFPFLSAVLLLGILHWAVRKRADGERARFAVVTAATSVAFYIAAGLSMTDMTLACCVSGALLIYGAGPCGPVMRLGIGALLGAGMIVKGPVAIVMFGLPVLVDAIVNRNWGKLFDWRWLVWSLPIALVVAVPWFVMVEARNPGSVWYFFYNENFMRFISHDYGDKYGAGREAFRGVSVLWALVATLPWCLAIPLKRPDWKDFSLVSMLAIVGFWCLTSRVLVYYLFPVVPLFAAWLARTADCGKLKRFQWPAAVVAMIAVIGMFGGGALFSDKFQGAKTPFSSHGSTYAWEFYHGTHPEALKNAESK